MTLPPPLGTVEYAARAYRREMERAWAEREHRETVGTEEEA